MYTQNTLNFLLVHLKNKLPTKKNTLAKSFNV